MTLVNHTTSIRLQHIAMFLVTLVHYTMEVFSKYSSLKSIHFSIYFIIIFEFMYLHIIIEGENINQSISYEI